MDLIREGAWISAEWWAERGDLSYLVQLLRDPDWHLTQSERAFIADVLEGRHRRGRGRPKGSAAPTWAHLGSVDFAAEDAERYLRVWRQRYGAGQRVVGADGVERPTVEEACLRAVARLERQSGGRVSADPSAVMELRRRAKSRRK